MTDSLASPPDVPGGAPLSEVPTASTDELTTMDLAKHRRLEQRRKELDSMRQQKAPNARKKFRLSRLYRYRHDLVALRECGASHGEIRAWLKKYKKVTVATTTVLRFLASLQEDSSNQPARDGQLDSEAAAQSTGERVVTAD